LSPECFVGIDVSKDNLDVAVRPTDEIWQVSNNGEGIMDLIERLRGAVPRLIILEATGGWELGVVGNARRRELACRRGQPASGA